MNITESDIENIDSATNSIATNANKKGVSLATICRNSNEPKP